MQRDSKEVEEVAKALYVRAVKLLPRDIKDGFQRLMERETDTTGRTILATMVENIAVAERTRHWRGRAVFLASVLPTVAPSASFTSDCTATSCTFDGGASTDSDGTVQSWEWTFGDG